MNTTLTKITPMLAERWLSKVPDFQRKIDAKQVRKLVIAIQRKEWRQNGATIVFNENDELIDGQHRLKAVVESGATIESLVIRGVSSGEDTFHTIGDDKPRRLTDFLHCKNAVVVGSVLRMYWMVTSGLWPIGRGANSAAPIADIMKLGKKWSTEIEPLVEPLRAAGRITGQHSFCVFIVLYHTKLRPIEGAEGRISEFFARVGDGVGLAATCPAYKLRQRFLSLPANGRIDRLSAQAYILKALYLYIDGLPSGHIRFDPNKEAFPELRGLRK